MLLLDLGII